jgi:hypothetical protein
MAFAVFCRINIGFVPLASILNLIVNPRNMAVLTSMTNTQFHTSTCKSPWKFQFALTTDVD